MLNQVAGELCKPLVKRHPRRAGPLGQGEIASQTADRGKVAVVVIMVGAHGSDPLGQRCPTALAEEWKYHEFLLFHGNFHLADHPAENGD